MPYSKRLNSSLFGLSPFDQALAENGGLATAKSKAIRLPSEFLKYGSARVLPRHSSAVGCPCRIIFIRASAQVALSISWPKIEIPRGASSAALSSSEPEPQVGS